MRFWNTLAVFMCCFVGSNNYLILSNENLTDDKAYHTTGTMINGNVLPDRPLHVRKKYYIIMRIYATYIFFYINVSNIVDQLNWLKFNMTVL